jgi:hypothetical protein
MLAIANIFFGLCTLSSSLYPERMMETAVHKMKMINVQDAFSTL